MIRRGVLLGAIAIGTVLPCAAAAPEAAQDYPAQGWVVLDYDGSAERTFVVGRASVRVSHNRFVWSNGAARHEVALPPHVKAFVPRYRRNRGPEPVGDVDETIGPVVPEGDRLWFGIRVYEGEGSEGVGGLGFIDVKSGRLGLLRHPGLVDCSSAELQLRPGAIVVRTQTELEYGNQDCHGSVEVARTPGLDASMLEQARREWDWFEGAVQRGRVKHHQRCRIVAGKPEQLDCEPSLDWQSARNLHLRKKATPVPVMARLVAGLIDRDMTRYRCTPGWFTIGAGIDIRPAGRVNAPFPPAERSVVVRRADGGSVRVRLATALEAEEWTVSELKTEDLSCEPKFERYSGPAFTRATVDLRVIEIDQTYAPGEK